MELENYADGSVDYPLLNDEVMKRIEENKNG